MTDDEVGTALAEVAQGYGAPHLVSGWRTREVWHPSDWVPVLLRLIAAQHAEAAARKARLVALAESWDAKDDVTWRAACELRAALEE